MRKVIIIQARMGSERLPGKVLISIKGKSVLAHIVERLRHCNRIQDIVVATSVERKDDVIEDECNNINVKCFRGSEEDVLSRYYNAALKNKADLIIRITGDCPVIDYSIIDKMIEKFCKLDEMKKIDYMSNFDIMKNTFPRGMDVEIIKMETLKIAYEYAEKLSEREHVTPYIYNNPNKFKLMGYTNEGEDLSCYRLTLDTKEDFKLIEVIYENLYEKDNNFGMNDIINFIKSNPKVLDINKNVIQKTL